jgi:DNA-binding FrmR family transcriptional regulator
MPLVVHSSLRLNIYGADREGGQRMNLAYVISKNSIPPYAILTYTPSRYLVRRDTNSMSHTIRDKKKLLARVRRIKGQLDGLERALEDEVACSEVLRQLASVRGAIIGLTTEVMEDHIREHILDARSPLERSRGGEELINVLQTYMK